MSPATPCDDLISKLIEKTKSLRIEENEITAKERKARVGSDGNTKQKKDKER